MKWYRLPEPREPLEWELLRALARPSDPEAARRLLDQFSGVSGYINVATYGNWPDGPLYIQSDSP